QLDWNVRIYWRSKVSRSIRLFGFLLAALACFALGVVSNTNAQSSGLRAPGVRASGIRTYCNPLDLNYQYNFEHCNDEYSYRSGADPVILNHKKEYYLFGTIAQGWWHSKDLINWRHVHPDKWPMRGVVAPAAISVGDKVYLLPSTYDRFPILSTTTPETGHLEYFNRLLPFQHQGPWDPSFFHDPDTDEWYLYWGSSNLYPLYGIKLDYQRRLLYEGDRKEFFKLHPEKHGWERFGQDHRETIDPFMEGAWMTKHGGKYYLQYGAPGSEYNVYANGTYVGDGPMGPFSYAPYNPVSYKPGGFVTGAGHGSTFQDNFGNYWNSGTPWIGVNNNMERRIAMFPAGFDHDGQMFANTRFGDFPHFAPTEKWAKKDQLFTGWMLLSYRKPAKATSVLDKYSAQTVTDENPRTFWVAESNQAGQLLTVDLLETFDIKALQVNYSDYQTNICSSDESVYTQFRIHGSTDKQKWTLLADLTGAKRDRPNAYIELPKPTKARYIRYEHVYVASPHLAISDLRVFGNGAEPPPPAPAGLTAERDTDARNAFITWEAVPSAVGYNVLWGIAKDKLYQTYQVFADSGSRLEVRALNVGQAYHFAIEAFDENGVSKMSEVVSCK
ncbi:MAG: family 43 glycosylhydrolase, partial [Pseudomonadales bacterium]